MGHGIFVSYRTADAAFAAGRIWDRLREEFSSADVFRDVQSVAMGDNVFVAIGDALESCCVLLAVIGPRWLGGEHRDIRLKNEGDYVRIEIEAALARGIEVIPLLIGQVEMPTRDQVPDSLEPFLGLAAHRVRDESFDRDIAPLVERLRELRLRQPARTTGTAAIEAYCKHLSVRLRRVIGRYRMFHSDLGPPDTLDELYVPLEVVREVERIEKGGKRGVFLDMRAGARVPLGALAKPRGRWIVAGGPGSGKTTLLRHYALELARSPHRGFVAVFASLYDWRMQVPLLDYVKEWVLGRESQRVRDSASQELRVCGRDAKLLLLLDGLDELSEDRRPRFREELADLLEIFPECPVIVTSRRYGTPLYVGEDFGSAVLSDLRPERAAELMFNLLASQADTRSRAASARDEWLGRFQDGPRFLRDFGKVPLFVTLLAVLERGGVKLAARRHEVIEEAFTALCLGEHRESREHNPFMTGRSDPGARLADLRRDPEVLARIDACLTVLGWLALRMTQEGRLTAPGSQLVEFVAEAPSPVRAALFAVGPRLRSPSGAELATREFLHRIAQETLVLGPTEVVEAGEGSRQTDAAIYRFWHRNFQEALSARELHRQIAEAPTEAGGVRSLIQRLEFDNVSQEEIERATDDLRSRWQANHDDFWADLYELRNADVANQHELQDELDRLDLEIHGIISQSVTRSRRSSPWVNAPEAQQRREELVARRLAPLRAREELFGFWIETLALLAGRLSDPGVLILEVLGRQRSLCRRIVEMMEIVDVEIAGTLLRSLNGFEDRMALLDRLPEQVPATQGKRLVDLMTKSGQELSDSTDERLDRRGHLDLVDDALRRLAYRDRALVGAVSQARRLLLASCSAPDAAARLEDAALLTEVQGRPGVDLWAPISPGTFLMGSPGTDRVEHWDERPVRVKISKPFWIAAIPVTASLYRLFDPQHRILQDGLRCLSNLPPKAGALPVTRVTWHAARLFCRWATIFLCPLLLPRLRQRTEELGLGWEILQLRARLPTEAEWEYCARAGTSTRYFFGDEDRDLDLFGWHGDLHGLPRPVASKFGRPRGRDGAPPHAGANGWGLFDVHGNVLEWCSDWFEATRTCAEDPTGPEEGSLRVLRGGCCRDPAGYCRSANRLRISPDTVGDYLGFRIVLSGPVLVDGSSVGDR